MLIISRNTAVHRHTLNSNSLLSPDRIRRNSATLSRGLKMFVSSRVKNHHSDVLLSDFIIISFFIPFSLFASGKQGQSSQILYTKRAALSSQASTSFSSSSLVSPSSLPQESPEHRLPPSRPTPVPSSPSHSQAAMRAREFAADLFRRAQGGGKDGEGQGERRTSDGGVKEAVQSTGDKGTIAETVREEGGCKGLSVEERRTNLLQPLTSGVSHSLPQVSEQVMSPASSSSSPSATPTMSSCQEASPSEPGYVNYSRLHYRLQQPGAAEQNAGGER